MRISRDGNRCPSLSVSSSRHNLCTFRSSQPLPPKLSPHLTHIVDPETFLRTWTVVSFWLLSLNQVTVWSQTSPHTLFPCVSQKKKKVFIFLRQINEWTDKWWPIFSSLAKHSMSWTSGFANKQWTHGVKWRWGTFGEATLGRKANTGQRAMGAEEGLRRRGKLSERSLSIAVF